MGAAIGDLSILFGGRRRGLAADKRGFESREAETAAKAARRGRPAASCCVSTGYGIDGTGKTYCRKIRLDLA